MTNHYGDDFVQKWGTYAGDAVERDGDGKGADLSYTGIGDRILEHMREHDTLQATMRFGRDGNGAVVYVHTNTLPEWIDPADSDDPEDGILAGEGRVLQTRSDGMKDVVDALDDLDAATTAEIADHPAVDVGVRQVRQHLATLVEDHGVVDRERNPEDRREFVWCPDGLHRIGEHGDVELDTVDLDDLDDDENAELTRTTSYTWEFRNFAGSSTSSPAVEGGPSAPATSTGGTRPVEDDPPPD